MLALVWAAVLVPFLFRSRIAASPLDDVRRFEESMGILEGNKRTTPAAGGRWIVIPRTSPAQNRRRARIIRRRRQNFVRILAFAALTFVLGLVPALRELLLVHLAADVVLALYVWRLLVYKRREQERERVVRPLSAGVDDDEATRRVAESG